MTSGHVARGALSTVLDSYQEAAAQQRCLLNLKGPIADLHTRLASDARHATALDSTLECGEAQRHRREKEHLHRHRWAESHVSIHTMPGNTARKERAASVASSERCASSCSFLLFRVCPVWYRMPYPAGS